MSDTGALKRIAQKARQRVLSVREFRFETYVKAIDYAVSKPALPDLAESDSRRCQMDAMKVLVVYDAASMFTATVLEYVRSFELMPSCDISYLHVTHGAGGSVNLSSFDVVIHTYGARFAFREIRHKKIS